MTEPVIPEILPILPVRNVVLFPRVGFPLHVGRPQSIRLIDEVAVADKLFATVAQKDPEDEEPAPSGLYSIGTAVQIARLLKMPEGQQHVIVQGLHRVRIKEFVQTEPFLKAKVEIVHDEEPKGRAAKNIEAALLGLKNLGHKLVAADPQTPDEVNLAIANVDKAGELANLLTFHLDLPIEERQEVLETVDVAKRVEHVTTLVARELAKVELSEKIQSKARQSIEKSQREYFLRQQLEEIRRELGEGGDEGSEAEELRARIDAAQLPEEARAQAHRELERLSRIPTMSPEHSVIRTYLEWMATLPWNKRSKDPIQLKRAQTILDEDHYGLVKVKQRIIEFLAVLKLKGNHRGPILCLVGPPGVGKTSLGRSVARATQRKFIRASLGGVRDEAEIRGHRRTYIGALPGRILRSLRDAGSKNPVFILDEVDKLGFDYHGDPASALLEVLDPEQNHSFVDHYLDVPFALSEVMFIATANYLDPVPAALRDRMEVIALPGYTEQEKIEIALRHLIPRLLEDHGLKRKNLKVAKTALREIIRSYTREAGLRELERKLAAVCRAVARKVASRKDTRVSLIKAEVSRYLGPPIFLHDALHKKAIPGIVTGLAWSPYGGEILSIEATFMRGHGQLILTGHLGEVMRESAQTSVSNLRSKAAQLSIEDQLFAEADIHIHVPAGAIPKDGPSAGVAIYLALASLFRDQGIRPDLAVTGETTLRGQVLPVGGIKEKLLAAYRAGVTTVLLPEDNGRDLEELPREIRDALDIRLIGTLDQALEIALQAPRRRNRKRR
jgi:ATP-dependent Lon protease